VILETHNVGEKKIKEQPTPKPVTSTVTSPSGLAPSLLLVSSCAGEGDDGGPASPINQQYRLLLADGSDWKRDCIEPWGVSDGVRSMGRSVCVDGFCSCDMYTWMHIDGQVLVWVSE
jgi:hypothetical protein